ncbi:early endosome antigen 1-like [Impatiens glandulifera]|uniref:early endosome antigen 1-like n=1 Tax=Impatiens glandulifera TaxID=253017 RepID=UPI001FB05F56|nr:early endosome antigen 1-like [Impatiens glandulifera]
MNILARICSGYATSPLRISLVCLHVQHTEYSTILIVPYVLPGCIVFAGVVVLDLEAAFASTIKGSERGFCLVELAEFAKESALLDVVVLMGFNSVYRNLREVFPQIDNRLLRAVAIEHSKDADVAVGVVLTEIIPRITQQKVASSSSNIGGSNDRKAKFHPTSPVSSCNSSKKDSDINTIADDNMHFGQKDIVGHSIMDSNIAVSKASSPVKQCSDGNSMELDDVFQHSQIPAKESVMNASEGNLHSDLTGISSMDAETLVAVKEPTEYKDESAIKPLVDGSGEVCRIDMLEGFTEDAKLNKETLVSAVVLVTSLLKEIEIQEKEVEDVKKRAASRFSDILTRVEDLKDIMERAQEANEMHAGEIFGEKDILDTEVRRLQSRLLNLSEEKNKTLDILDEMHCKLGERLAEAEKVVNTAEIEMVEKEKLAKTALSEQQLILIKVIEESKKLNREAEENTKFREFLRDNGPVVDILKEEVSTICQDVKLLKGKLDELRTSCGEYVEPVQLLREEVDLVCVPNEPRASARDYSKAIDDEWDLC